ncbi:unnamed protein product [Oncorhynchus mykiss]|uniref:BAR domain-containing protein n=1 Tax=Oncorhynchus mykiss TaxID=8022 RepID=A0A060Y782_ONCMY|nr:unnamed protein product [Oncorhynchus mykiss]
MELNVPFRYVPLSPDWTGTKKELAILLMPSHVYSLSSTYSSTSVINLLIHFCHQPTCVCVCVSGSTLITVGEYQIRLGGAEREFLQTSAINFLTPLRNFLEGDWRTISKERRLLENRRLDLDICKARVKKAKQAEAKAAAEPDFQETRPRNYVLSASASAQSSGGWDSWDLEDSKESAYVMDQRKVYINRFTLFIAYYQQY